MIRLTKMNVVIRDRGILQPRHSCLCFITQGAWSSPVLQALSIPALPFCQVNLCCHDVSFWKCFGSVRLVRLFVFFQPPPGPSKKLKKLPTKEQLRIGQKQKNTMTNDHCVLNLKIVSVIVFVLESVSTLLLHLQVVHLPGRGHFHLTPIAALKLSILL